MADFQDWKLTDWRAGFLMDVGNYTDWPRSPDFHHNILYCKRLCGRGDAETLESDMKVHTGHEIFIVTRQETRTRH